MPISFRSRELISETTSVSHLFHFLSAFVLLLFHCSDVIHSFLFSPYNDNGVQVPYMCHTNLFGFYSLICSDSVYASHYVERCPIERCFMNLSLLILFKSHWFTTS
ncbi:hypothetical protein BT93_H3537 [Corymbia citriodora subsp. variegata]|nr:hypothetical protein BT93_H3537 [Corymbia citriodora subsp. variegata]